jgi:hypothetical protein
MHDYLPYIYLIKVWGYMIYETAPFSFYRSLLCGPFNLWISLNLSQVRLVNFRVGKRGHSTFSGPPPPPGEKAPQPY